MGIGSTLVRTLLFVGVSVVPALAGNQILLRNFSPSDGTPALLVAGNNQLLVISTLTASGQQISRVVELDLTGARLTSTDLSQLQSPAAAAVDSQGNVIVAGVPAAQSAIAVAQ